MYILLLCSFFFFNDTATTEIYTLSLHDALPISVADIAPRESSPSVQRAKLDLLRDLDRGALARYHNVTEIDRKSTRLNSSHSQISYAVFCLKKKKKNKKQH